MADFSVIDGRVLGGEQGEGILVENLQFKFSTTKEGEEEAVAEFTGFAKTYLNDKWNPSNGFKELPEPFPVTDRVKFVLGGGKSADNSILLDRLNKALEISPPLEDTPDLWERLTKDGKDSVYNKIVGGKLYFTAKRGTKGTGEKPEDFFYNVVALAKREDAEMEKVGDRMKKLMAKKAAPASNFSPD